MKKRLESVSQSHWRVSLESLTEERSQLCSRSAAVYSGASPTQRAHTVSPYSGSTQRA